MRQRCCPSILILDTFVDWKLNNSAKPETLNICMSYYRGCKYRKIVFGPKSSENPPTMTSHFNQHPRKLVQHAFRTGYNDLLLILPFKMEGESINKPPNIDYGGILETRCFQNCCPDTPARPPDFIPRTSCVNFEAFGIDELYRHHQAPIEHVIALHNQRCQ